MRYDEITKCFVDDKTKDAMPPERLISWLEKTAFRDLEDTAKEIDKFFNKGDERNTQYHINALLRKIKDYKNSLR